MQRETGIDVKRILKHVLFHDQKFRKVYRRKLKRLRESLSVRTETNRRLYCVYDTEHP